jgi:hypothetical protein
MNGTINPLNVSKAQHIISAYGSVQGNKQTQLIIHHFKHEIHLNSTEEFQFLPQNNHSKSPIQAFWDVQSSHWVSGS